ncbi:uncharacterized protein DUF4112 [Sphingobacterium alimentarium]|uniref:Uncharacterized protein DUF4112 n=1 Tax=Sphingobacterium alimentarium TaxID=797292 RepID=A0A4V2VU53_9SPHI|nr:DUF4112 domain-containing protein [Sphingobacterium alimentarium]TCV11846.1 uncharacterized protein DUF4112 [Sphingobacterium alimentarium]
MEENKQLVQQKRAKEFAWIEQMATLLDNKFNIGGFRFGLDPLLNLIPYAGQVVSFTMSMGLVIVILRNGAGSKVGVKMLFNILLDAILGSIPLLGYAFDFFNKANKKNVRLLREHYFENKHQGSAKGLLITLFIIIVILCVGFIYLMWLFADWVFTTVGSIF